MLFALGFAAFGAFTLPIAMERIPAEEKFQSARGIKALVKLVLADRRHVFDRLWDVHIIWIAYLWILVLQAWRILMFIESLTLHVC